MVMVQFQTLIQSEPVETRHDMSLSPLPSQLSLDKLKMQDLLAFQQIIFQTLRPIDVVKELENDISNFWIALFYLDYSIDFLPLLYTRETHKP